MDLVKVQRKELIHTPTRYLMEAGVTLLILGSKKKKGKIVVKSHWQSEIT